MQYGTIFGIPHVKALTVRQKKVTEITAVDGEMIQAQVHMAHSKLKKPWRIHGRISQRKS